MEFISEKRGVKMMSTPKYHCELAGGEVIEYAWGFIKSRYRRIPLSQKRKNVDQFRASLKCVFRVDIMFQKKEYAVLAEEHVDTSVAIMY